MGKMIVIEGMDGAGTTTQSKLLCAHLKEYAKSVLRTAEPTQSVFGQEIRHWLKKPIEDEPYLLAMLALAFAADRMHHIHHVIAPTLKSHDFLIVDRYVLSSFVYQGLHLPSSYIEEINKFALKPDITIVLDIAPDEALARLKQRDSVKDFYESKALLEKIRDRYLSFASKDPGSYFVVDAHEDVNKVQLRILEILRQYHIL